MTVTERQTLQQMAQQYSHVQMFEFTDDLMSYMAAADGVISMGGYNTLCEILSARKPAVVIPRIHPSQEQLVRAEKMTQLGLFQSIHPAVLTPELLFKTLFAQLDHPQKIISAIKQLTLNGNTCIAEQICQLLGYQSTFPLVNGDRQHLIAA
jgi:predicted glycosyltransferase